MKNSLSLGLVLLAIVFSLFAGVSCVGGTDSEVSQYLYLSAVKEYEAARLDFHSILEERNQKAHAILEEINALPEQAMLDSYESLTALKEDVRAYLKDYRHDNDYATVQIGNEDFLNWFSDGGTMSAERIILYMYKYSSRPVDAFEVVNEFSGVASKIWLLSEWRKEDQSDYDALLASYRANFPVSDSDE